MTSNSGNKLADVLNATQEWANVRLYNIQEPDAAKDANFITSTEAITVIGIDLGTTNSLVGYVKDGAAYLIPDQDTGKNYTPSVIANVAGRVLIGQAAQDSGLGIFSVKRLLGDLNLHTMQMLNFGNRKITPIEASAIILKHLKARAETHLGKVEKAVITVPAYFDERARQATKDAARIAGLEVVRLLSEPTAAAIAYGLDSNPEGIYAVYDLGGGTFDVSILKMEKGVFQVLATGGDTFLGGDDIDILLHPFIPDRTKARLVKEKLSTEFEVNSISRQQLEALAGPIINRTLAIFRETLASANITAKDLKEVILVGGATRMPMVIREIGALTGKQPVHHINPDEVVAIGATLQANALVSGSNNLLIDVIPLSLGIEVADGLTEIVIPRNTPIPSMCTKLYATQKANQTGIVIHVIQGEGVKVSECRSLATFELKGIPPMPRGGAKVEVKFQIDADGLLTVHARELTTGKAQEIVIKPSYGLTEEEVARLLD